MLRLDNEVQALGSYMLVLTQMDLALLSRPLDVDHSNVGLHWPLIMTQLEVAPPPPILCLGIACACFT